MTDNKSLMSDGGGRGGPGGTERGGSRGGGGSTGRQPGSDGGEWSWTKRLLRQPVTGFSDLDDRSAAKSSDTGRQDYFGVRSYLGQFYDLGQDKSAPPTYRKYSYNWRTRRPQAQCSGLYWWKTMAMFGAGCLLIGIVTIIAGFLTPARPIVVGPQVDGGDGRRPNDDAGAFDFKLEICRMVGLTMFCAGGLILAVSLMVPTFFYPRCSSAAGADDNYTQPVIVAGDGSDTEGDRAGPLPMKSAVPATEMVTGVQPTSKLGESALVSDTLVPYD